MNDLEICERIAEIEGVHIKNGTVDSNGEDLVLLQYEDNVIKGVWNPLTDDALCFQLMVKYKISLCGYSQPDGVISAYDVDRNGWINKECSDISPNKAICLAIIEAHNEG